MQQQQLSVKNASAIARHAIIHHQLVRLVQMDISEMEQTLVLNVQLEQLKIHLNANNV